MPNQYETNAGERSPAEQWAFALGWITVAVVGGLGIVFATRSRRRDRESDDEYAPALASEQALTVRAPLETAETAWVEWCASGHSKLKSDYAVRFEPAPGARGTQVHLTGGGSAGANREELRRFKQRLETGEIPVSDGPGLSRPAQPRVPSGPTPFAEV